MPLLGSPGPGPMYRPNPPLIGTAAATRKLLGVLQHFITPSMEAVLFRLVKLLLEVGALHY
jgi:hypothetical protein